MSPRAAGKVADAVVGRENELPTFPPLPSFYHRISGPSHRHGSSFLLPALRELGSLPRPASSSSAHSLRRPRPLMRCSLPRRTTARPSPSEGCVYLHVCPPTPTPSVCSSHVSLRFAVEEGGKVVSPMLNFAIASLHLLWSQCACREISAITASC